MKSPTLEALLSSPGTRDAVKAVQEGIGYSDLAMLYAFWHLDHELGGELPGTEQKVFDNKRRERGKGKFLYSIHTPAMWGDIEDFVEMVVEQAETDLYRARAAAQLEAERLAALPPKKPYKRPSKEAMRKRLARKEGRVKARPLKPPRTAEQKVASWEKAYRTRLAAWKAANQRDAPPKTYIQIARMQASLHKAHSTWQIALNKLPPKAKV